MTRTVPGISTHKPKDIIKLILASYSIYLTDAYYFRYIPALAAWLAA